ncbi:hypothetical protein HWV00_00185 [Moritella sp. 24]|uniref:hypothetical protein n=1 Tax=Moritella sp. 24 TaxID=2746230 RepID=UPI001BA4E3F9|nr:hypothetical protein [Moritella sp. 24]QUM74810.1 hypothetical protein HWV00_00185 [Moritella sp. 24]
MKRLFAFIVFSAGLYGCQSTQNYKYQPTKLDNITIVRYQEMADNYQHLKFDRYNSILTVIYQLPASNLVWQPEQIEKQTRHTLCVNKKDTIYRLAHEDNIGVKFVYKGQGGEIIGPWAIDICEPN